MIKTITIKFSMSMTGDVVIDRQDTMNYKALIKALSVYKDSIISMEASLIDRTFILVVDVSKDENLEFLKVLA